MKKLFLAGCGAMTLFVGGPTVAADMPVKVAAPAVVRPACAQFGGGYIGVHGGAVLHDWTWNDNNAWAKNEVDLALPDSSHSERFGFEVGPRIGWDWQRGCTLFGVVADWSWSGLTSSRNHTDGQPGAAFDHLSVARKLDWYGTLRARAGLVMDNALIYVTGGFAYASIKWSASLTNILAAGPVTETFGNTDTRWGGVVGVGTEWAFSPNWSVTGEFLYMRFDDRTTTFSSNFAILNGNPAAKSFTQQDSLWVSRIALNYRWGGR